MPINEDAFDPDALPTEAKLDELSPQELADMIEKAEAERAEVEAAVPASLSTSVDYDWCDFKLVDVEVEGQAKQVITYDLKPLHHYNEFEKQHATDLLVSLVQSNQATVNRLANDPDPAARLGLDPMMVMMMRLDLLLTTLMPPGTGDRIRYDYNFEVMIRAQLDDAEEQQRGLRFGVRPNQEAKLFVPGT